MTDPIISHLLNDLLDKYESSKSFIGENKVRQRFQIKIGDLYPDYLDHANYEVFQTVNEAIDLLSRNELIWANIGKANVCKDIQLNLDKIEEAYRFLGRTVKRDVQDTARSILTRYQDKHAILRQYCAIQLERLAQNKPIHYFNNDFIEFEQVLQAVEALDKVQRETFYRDFSMQVFRDSKVFDRICGKVASLLYEYGEFAEKDQVLAELNLVKNPTYVHIKGAAKVIINGDKIDLSALHGDIAFSSTMLNDIDRVDLTGRAVMTIENLTSFHLVDCENRLVIYLGGFHNTVRRHLIMKIHQQNPDVAFYHFGDIDAGGFQILQHLRRQTGINFIPYKMDLESLQKYQDSAKALTENDRGRLNKLKGQGFDEVIDFMLLHNIKLEQEAVRET
ncbi:MAG: DUF2220 family protein [Clostridiaceae bacterium]|nr:DUF2220 family protein [Clostridiaceae bacterium]